uniref:Uncharacterized protein n=1 Tax=Anguilla anguilla TaxID=7936 RepID=A0A0E9SIK8_ANGAN
MLHWSHKFCQSSCAFRSISPMIMYHLIYVHFKAHCNHCRASGSFFLWLLK